MILIDGTFHSQTEIDAKGEAFLAATGITDPRLSVAVCLSETVDWLSAFFAIKRLGASILPLLPGTPLATARKLAKEAGCHRLYHGGTTAEWLGEPDDESPCGRLLQMSSGTTGAAKCVARGWDDIERELEDYVGFFREPQDMTPVVACPTTHSYGLICGLLVGLKRGRVPHVVNTANPKHLIKVLRETERPILYSSPAMLHTLARLLPSGEKVHAIMTSGTLLPESWFSTIRAKAERRSTSNMAARKPVALRSTASLPIPPTWAASCRVSSWLTAAPRMRRSRSCWMGSPGSRPGISAMSAPMACWSSSRGSMTR